jgi:hypothetical protein
MTTKSNRSTGVILPSSGLAHKTELFALTAQAHVSSLNTSSPEEKYLTQEMRVRLQRQLIEGILTEHAQQLSQVISLRTIERFDEFVEADTALRNRERPVRDQADIEVFNNAVRQAQANTLLAVRNAGAHQIEQVVVEPLTLPQEGDIIVEEDPGFFGRLFGGQKTIRVCR